MTSRPSFFHGKIFYQYSQTNMSATTTETKTPLTFGEVMDKAAKSALRGGTAGAVAMGLNVGALMWMRTTVRLDVDYRNSFYSRNLFIAFDHVKCLNMKTHNNTGELPIQKWYLVPSGSTNPLRRWRHSPFLPWGSSCLNSRTIVSFW